MARLTRTKKYAELREKMNQDREESISSKDLSQYESKLDNLQKQFDELFNTVSINKLQEKVVETKDEEKDILNLLQTEPEKEPEVLAAVPKIEPIVLEEKKNERKVEISSIVEQKIKELELLMSTQFDDAPKASEETADLADGALSVDEENEALEAEDNTVNEPVKTDSYEDVSEKSDVIISLMDEEMKPAPVVEEKVQESVQEPIYVPAVEEVKEEPVVINYPEAVDIFEAVTNEADVIISLMDEEMKPAPIVEEETQKAAELAVEEMFEEIEEEETVADTPALEEEVQEETPEEIAEFEETKEIDEVASEIESFFSEMEASITKEAPISDVFVKSTIDEVEKHNKELNKDSVTTIINTLIDEQRHSNVIIPEEDDEDEEFSNSITLELDKVLNDIASSKLTEKETEEVLVEETKESEVEEEHPVLALPAEEDVVEIKNISETLNLNKDDKVLSDTIPFMVPTSDDEDEEDDEDYEDDDTPSKILNVILGVLIFVLILVLGIIIYYILVARGIIG